MKIGICDDEEMMRREIRKICEQVVMNYDLNYEIVEFQDGYEVLQYPKKLDILLLDIKMPEVSGIEVKNQLWDRGVAPLMIFVSCHEERMREAFGLNVVGFVKKGNMGRELPVQLASTIQKAEHFVILDGGVDSREIAYIHTEQMYCKVFLVDGCEKVLRIPMKELEFELTAAGFVRAHRSYLVNLQYVEAVDDNMVYILSQKIPVSVRKRSKVKKAYEDTRK